MPLVLHLLARSRYRTVDWGGMMFLRGRDWRRDQAARVKQWVLLGVRMLMVGCLAVALSRPVVKGRWSGSGQGGRTTAVIVLDRSFSMSYEEAGRSRLDKAKAAVLQVLASLRSGDEVSLVLLGEQVEVRYSEPTGNLQVVAREVAEVQASGGKADIAGGLAAAREILEHPSRANRELYVVCDRQAVSWRGLEGETGIGKWLKGGRGVTRFYVMGVGGEDVENVAVESVVLGESPAVRGRLTDVEVKLRNYGGVARVGMEMVVSVVVPSDGPKASGDAGRELKRVSVSVVGGGVATVRVPVVFEEVGSHVVTAWLKGGGLEADNRCSAVVDVIEPISVLILSGEESVEEVRRESFFLKLALMPYQTALKKGGDPAVVTVRRMEEWGKVDLGKYQVVVLANVREVSAEQGRALEQRVYEGGGLIIGPGNLSRVENYNEVLYRNGMGVMPGKLSAAVAADGSKATTLLGLDLSHPIFGYRRGGDPLPGAVVGRYFPALPRSADARVLGEYGSGEPFLIEGPRGKGRVLLVTTPLDADWSTLPLQAFFLPFVQSAVRYAGGGVGAVRVLMPGQAMVVNFEEGLSDRKVRVWKDDEAARVLTAGAGRNGVTYEETHRAGVYRVEAMVKGVGRRVLHYVVGPSREESDLAALREADWEGLKRALGFELVDVTGEGVTAQLSREREGRELWLYLLVGVMLLGVGELWLARRWTREVG